MRRSPPPRLAVVWTATLGLLLLPPDLAAAASSALVYGPAPAVTAEQALAEVQSRLAEPVSPERRVPSSALPVPVDPPLVPLGASPGSTCRPGGRAPEWLAVIAEAQRQLDALEYEKAIGTVSSGIEALPCDDQVVPAQVPGRLFMLRGLAQFFLNDPDQARASFRAAISLDRYIQWDTNYPPDPRQAFLDAREDALRAGTARIQVVAAPGEVAQFVVDGVAVADAARGVELLSGSHLIQYRMSDGSFFATRVQIGGGETRLLVTRSGAADVVMAGARRDELTYASRALASFLCRSWGVDALYVADLSEAEPYVYRFTLAGGRFERLEAPTPAVEGGGAVARTYVEGLLVLPNTLAEGAPTDTIVAAEGTRLEGAVRLFIGDQPAPSFARDGTRATFSPPPGLKPGVYDVRLSYADGTTYVSPMAFSVQADPAKAAPPPDVQYVPVELVIKADRLRVSVRWSYVNFRKTLPHWADVSLDANIRMGGGFCLDFGLGVFSQPGQEDPDFSDPRAYWWGGFKVRWYPPVVQTYLGLDFLWVLGSGDPGKGSLGPRGILGIDVIAPPLSAFFFNVEVGFAVLWDPTEGGDPYSWFNAGGGVGVRF